MNNNIVHNQIALKRNTFREQTIFKNEIQCLTKSKLHMLPKGRVRKIGSAKKR